MKRYETERLIFRDYEENDFDAVFAIMGDEETASYMYVGCQSEENVKGFIDKNIKNAKSPDYIPNFFAVILKETNELIGICEIGFARCNSAAVAWMINKNHSGKGYCTELGKELFRIAFEQIGLHRLYAHVDSENIASRRVMEKLGMRLEGTFLESRPANRYVKDKKKYSDEMIYAILHHEWEAKQGEKI